MMATECDEGRPDAESCPLCGDDVLPAAVQLQTGVPWGSHHHAHALCALENLAARVAALERLVRITQDRERVLTAGGGQMIPPGERHEWRQALAHAGLLGHRMGPILEMDHEHFSAECACGARIFSWPGGYIAYEPPVLPPHPR